MRPRNPRELLREAKTSAFLVTYLPSIRYLTDVELSSGVLLVTSRAMTLFTDGRYLEVAKGGRYRGIVVRDVRGLPSAIQRIRRCGFEAQQVTVERLRRWKREFLNTKFVHTVGVVEEFRRTKDAEELRRFRRAQRITRLLLRRVRRHLRPGVTERNVAEKLRTMAITLGADGLAFDPIVAFGHNTSRPHHHPSFKRLRKRDIAQIDVGVRYRGYCADQSAVYFVGQPTKLQRHVYAVVEEAKNAALRAVRAGVTNHELDRIARSVLKRHGFEKYFVHALGHGVGLEIHEGPSLSLRATKTTLLSGEIITIEPGVYIPGKFGIRLEEEVIVW